MPYARLRHARRSALPAGDPSRGSLLDATAGLGGHTGLIAERLTTGIVIANDRDAESIEMARRNTAECSARVRFHQGSFGTLPKQWRKRVSKSWTGCWRTWA